MTTEPATYPGYRFPAEIITHAVWPYHVFSLGLRDVELTLAERGITVTRESVRRWVLRFGCQRRAPILLRPGAPKCLRR
ncbi:MAG: IS6 family transposase [Solirubrobacterales bacterium]|nr:IS6 family transposase [Solirubrobacterales bacterium]